MPVVGGLIVGVMARVGSERIRGHGIPEAMETILLRGSRMEPRLAVLKPISSAVSIGTGGPFGAEGPIIVTGGALGSIVGQLLHLTAARAAHAARGRGGGRHDRGVRDPGRGRAAGGGASAVRVAPALDDPGRARGVLGRGGAGSARERRAVAGRAAVCDRAPTARWALSVTLGAVLVGLACGGLAWVMTRCVYGAEDLFGRLPLHWSWWPAIGGVFVGIGGLIDPRVLGVGYETIGAQLAGQLALGALAVLLVVKLAVWSIALGSNTSGGILAPLLMLGAALGGLLGAVLPGAGEGTWALIGMAAAMAGVMRSPFTSIVFALELTHDVNALLALLVACTIAHLVSVLTLKRSILTEKIARRGYHVTREYEIDPLHALLVADVMATDVLTVRPQTPTAELYERLPEGSAERRQRLYPVLDAGRDGSSVCWLSPMCLPRAGPRAPAAVSDLAREPILAFADETLREVADRMVSTGHGVLPVADRENPARLVGLVSQFDLLKAHERVLVEERHRERPLGPRRRVSAPGGRLPVREPAA